MMTFVKKNPDTIQIFNGFRSKTNKFIDRYISLEKNPKIAIWSVSPGIYVSKIIKNDFLNPLLEHYNQALPVTAVLIRADSGFATPEIYDLCEEKKHQYVIRLNRNSRLFKLEMRQIGSRGKNIFTPFAIKQLLGSVTVGFAFVLSGKRMN